MEPEPYTLYLQLDVITGIGNIVPGEAEIQRELWTREMRLTPQELKVLTLGENYFKFGHLFEEKHIFLVDHIDEETRSVYYKRQLTNRETLLFRSLPLYGFHLAGVVEMA